MESKVKYFLYLITFIFASHILTAQSFVELKQFTPFDSIRANTLLFFDYDNDNADDVIIMGFDKYNRAVSKIYKNTNGTLIEIKDSPFGEKRYSSVTAADIDNDGDLDLFFSSIDKNQLFFNTGDNYKRYITQSIYSESLFDGAQNVAISDLNNDGKSEFFLTYGDYGEELNIYRYYWTSEEEGYKEIKNHPINMGGIVRFSDIVNDGYEELLISGTNKAGEHKTKFYKNNSGTYEEMLDTPFGNVSYKVLEFSDIDNDGYEDLIVSEPNESNEKSIRLYKNKSGTFEEVLNTTFEDLTEVSLAFSDINNDGYNDLILNGKDKSDSYITKLYFNETGEFNTVVNIGLDSIGGGSIAFSDVDDDGFYDMLISGQNNGGKLITNLYKNERGEFIGTYGTPFEGLYSSSIAFSDVDNNGFQDILMKGHSNVLEGYTTRLFMNENGTFTEFIDSVFFDGESGQAAFSDIDNDGYEDLIIVNGDIHSGDVTKLYRNVKGKFVKVEDPPFKEIRSTDIVFSDIDNDGDEDLLLTGMVAKEVDYKRTNLYKNNDGVFIEVEDTPFVNLTGEAAFSDIDNNGFADLLITGTNDLQEMVSYLYKNEGGLFKVLENTPFVGLIRASPTFFDIDNDGDEDLFITGYQYKVGNVAMLYRNEGGNFTKINDISIKNDIYYTADYFDIDNNGFVDLLVGGYSSTLLYKNDNGVFTLDETVELDGLRAEFGTASFFDYNNDGNMDVFITGEDKDNNRIAKLYKNLGRTSTVEFNSSVISHDFELYPNPSNSDKFKININSEFIGQLDIEVLDINGKVILKINETIQLGQESVSVSTGFLTNGFYLVKIKNSEKEEIHKLIIQ